MIYSPDQYMGPEENLSANEQLAYDELVTKPLTRRATRINKQLEVAKKSGDLKKIMELEKEIKYQDYLPFLKVEGQEDGIYSAKIINDDITSAKEAKKKFEREASLRSELLEALLGEEIEGSGWLGEGSPDDPDKKGEAHATKTTEYDDYLNHTDIIVEFKNNEGEIIKLAIDATIGDSEEKILKKIKFIKNDLEKKCGTKIKYFQSSFLIEKEDETEEIKMGAINNFPRVVVACTKEVLGELCDLKRSSFDGSDDIKKTVFQLDMLEEIIDQVEEAMYFLKNKVNLPERIKVEDLPLFQEMGKILNHLQLVYKNKKGLIKKQDDQTSKVIKISRYFRI